MLTKEDLEAMGIIIPNEKEPEYTVYIIEWCERDKIDRTKFPYHRYTSITEKFYITWDQAYKAAKKFEKADPTKVYLVKHSSASKSKLTKKQLQEIKERGW